MQLRASDGRAVLAQDQVDLDADEIDLDVDLARALHEWARVAEAVAKAGTGDGPSAAGGLISRRGRQLAGRLAAEMGMVISYVDPLTGEIIDVGEPDDWPPQRTGGAHAVRLEREPARPDRRAQRTPWATGLTVSAFAAIVVLFAVIALSSALGSASRWLALAANVIIALGLAPSIWLARNVPVWRWVAYGVTAGIGLAWIALLFTLL